MLGKYSTKLYYFWFHIKNIIKIGIMPAVVYQMLLFLAPKKSVYLFIECFCIRSLAYPCNEKEIAMIMIGKGKQSRQNSINGFSFLLHYFLCITSLGTHSAMKVNANIQPITSDQKNAENENCHSEAFYSLQKTAIKTNSK